jgi:hypothetical protein
MPTGLSFASQSRGDIVGVSSGSWLATVSLTDVTTGGASLTFTDPWLVCAGDVGVGGTTPISNCPQAKVTMIIVLSTIMRWLFAFASIVISPKAIGFFHQR